MTNQLPISKNGDYTSNQAIAKSQKILNSASNHLKTQQDRSDEDYKSPQSHKVDFRETWRKPRMPHNKLLPQAFQMKQKKKKNPKDYVENIDKIVSENKHKAVIKQLNPIKIEKIHEQKAKETIENGNPLYAFQKYIQIKNKYNDIIGENESSTIKYKAFSSKQAAPKIKISDCITLQVIKRGHHTGTIKKMLHVPSLKLMCIREQPLNTKQSRSSIKQWIIFWESKLNRQQSKQFINVFNTKFNYPQGAVSIITEYFKNGSLLNLLSATITLPQSVIREIFIQVIESLANFYQATEMHFGGLSPSQIMISDDGKVKLGMGLYYHFPNINSNSIYHIKSSLKQNKLDFNTTHKNFMKNSIQKPINLELQRSYDTFKLGLLLLECAIGGFQNFQQSAILHQTLKIIFTEEGQRIIQRDNACCLIHSQTYLLQFSNQQDERSKRDKLEINKVILYIKLLKDRFSMEFVNFLCMCLKLSHNKRATITQMFSHYFINKEKNKDAKTVKVSLNDLLHLMDDLNQDFIESTKQQKLDKFIGHMLHVLNDCKKEVLVDLITNEKDKIMNLNKYLGLHYIGLGQRLNEAIIAMIKS